MEKSQVRKIFSRVGIGMVALVAIQQVLVVAISMVLGIVAPWVLETSWIIWPLSYIPLYCVGLPVMLAIFKTVPSFTGGPPEKTRFSVPGLLAIISACWALTYVLNLLMYYLADLIEKIKGTEVVNMLAETATASNPWFNFVAVAIVAPIMEEFIFRKKLYDKLVVFGGKTYILVSAFIFAIFHINFYQLVYAFLLGVIFAAMTYMTGTIKYSIIAHIGINFMGAGGSGLVLYYASVGIYEIWNYLLLAVVAIGLIVVVWWLIKKRKTVEFAPAQVPLPSKGIVFGNVGMLLYTILFGLLILYALIV